MCRDCAIEIADGFPQLHIELVIEYGYRSLDTVSFVVLSALLRLFANIQNNEVLTTSSKRRRRKTNSALQTCYRNVIEEVIYC